MNGHTVMLMIAPNSRTRKGRKEEGKSDYGGMVQPSQQLIAPCENGLGIKCLRIVAAFWAGIPVEVTQESA